MEVQATPNDYYSKIVTPNILFWIATKLLIFEIIASFIMTIFYTKITDAPISFIKEWWYYIPLIIALIICYKKNIKNVILPIAVLFIVVRRVLLFVKVIQLGNISNALTLSLPQLLAWILVFVITLIFSLNIADGAKKYLKTLFFLPFIIFVVAIVMYMKNVGIDLFKIAVNPLDIKGFIWLVLNVLCFVSEALVILMICGCVTETKNHFAIIATILLGVLLLALTIIYSLFIGKNGIKIANTEKVILNNNENKEEKNNEGFFGRGNKDNKDEKTQTGNLGTVFFGVDEDGNLLEWIVLEKKGDKSFLITKNVLVLDVYYSSNADGKEITWEESDARKYFNGEFLEKTFTNDEQNSILITDVKTKDNEKYNTNGGNDTKDKVFLLSIEEVKKYFKKDDMAAKNKKGEYQDWTLRTPGADAERITKVTPDWKKQNADGTYDNSSVDFDGWSFTSNANEYRPALWAILNGNTTNKVNDKINDTQKKEKTKDEKTKEEEETVEKDNKENDSDISLDNKKFFSGWDNDSYYKDGKKITNDWVEEDNKWYYLKSDSKYAKSEWVDINGDYYYFDSKGAMVSNQWVENKYYVGSDGKMLKNTTTPDGFLVGADGSYVSQNTTTNASANVFISNDTTNVGSVANNTSATNGSADTKVAGKFDAGLVSYYHTVNDGKSKEYSEAKFDSDGKLWMYRDIGDNQYGIMIYDSFDKKTYYFFDDDNESYAKDGKIISMAEAERIYTKWDGFSDYYEAYMDNE